MKNLATIGKAEDFSKAQMSEALKAVAAGFFENRANGFDFPDDSKDPLKFEVKKFDNSGKHPERWAHFPSEYGSMGCEFHVLPGNKSLNECRFVFMYDISEETKLPVGTLFFTDVHYGDSFCDATQKAKGMKVPLRKPNKDVVVWAKEKKLNTFQIVAKCSVLEDHDETHAVVGYTLKLSKVEE